MCRRIIIGGVTMRIGTRDFREKADQKEILKRNYSDYDPKRHDAYVIRYNADLDKKRLADYEKNRGIR
jgi:hypothetical protein